MTELNFVVGRDPNFWRARLTLGLTFSRAPVFLGHTRDAIAHLEYATSDRGIPGGRMELAEALSELAGLYDRVGRTADAMAIRSRAKRLFPNDRRFSLVPTRPDDAGAAGALTEMSDITVTAATVVPEESRPGQGLSSLEMVTAPGATGDLMQALQTLPGVTGGSESSDLSLRGGDPYESPVFLNGGRLAYAGKFESLSGGLFGAIDPDVLRAARVSAGGFSARFGDALSGIIEADAIGRPAVQSRRVAFNTVGPSATFMQPLGERAGVWGSIRIANTSVLLRMHSRRGDYVASPQSMEGIAGATRVFAGGELRAVILGEHAAAAPELAVGGDTGGYHSEGTTVAGVFSGQFIQVGPLASLRLTATVSSRHTGTRFGVLDLSRRLQRAGVRIEGGTLLGATTLLRGGLELSHIGEPLDGAAPTTAIVAPGSPVKSVPHVRHGSSHFGSFAELQLFPAAWVTITPGLRLDRLPGELAGTVDPRLHGEVRIGAYTISLAGAVFH